MICSIAIGTSELVSVQEYLMFLTETNACKGFVVSKWTISQDTAACDLIFFYFFYFLQSIIQEFFFLTEKWSTDLQLHLLSCLFSQAFIFHIIFLLQNHRWLKHLTFINQWPNIPMCTSKVVLIWTEIFAKDWLNTWVAHHLILNCFWYLLPLPAL